MDRKEENSTDFYAVLGLKKDCTEAELRNAYKKLALRWHPDRCSAPGNLKFVEEAKMKFQAIQQAYSVLSDANKKFLYDVGVYDSDDDENQGMGDFLNEMAVMMSQNKPSENGGESFEDLKELFEEMFKSDIESFGSTSQNGSSTSYSSSSSSFGSCSDSSNGSHKRNSSQMERTKVESSSGFDAQVQGFCFGAEQRQENLMREKGAGDYRRGGEQNKSNSRSSSIGALTSRFIGSQKLMWSI